MRDFVEQKLQIVKQIIDWFYFPIFRKFIPIETFRYAFTGSANTTLDITLYFICYNFVLDKQFIDLGFVMMSPHIAAFFIVFPITFSSGFLLSKFVTFSESELKGKVQLRRYGITVAGAILINYVLLKLFVDIFHIYPTAAKLIITIIVVIYSYILQKAFTFKTVTYKVKSN